MLNLVMPVLDNVANRDPSVPVGAMAPSTMPYAQPAPAIAFSFPTSGGTGSGGGETQVPLWLEEPWEAHPSMFERRNTSQVLKQSECLKCPQSPRVAVRRRDSFSHWCDGPELVRPAGPVPEEAAASTSYQVPTRPAKRHANWPRLLAALPKQAVELVKSIMDAVEAALKESTREGCEGECAGTAALELCAVRLRPSLCLKFTGFVGGKRVSILVDSGASQNYADETRVKEWGCELVPARLGSKRLVVRLANGSLQEAKHMAQLTFAVQSNKHTATFVCTKLEGEDLILGMPWLTTVNPRICWRSRKLYLRDARRHSHVIRAGEVDTTQGLELEEMEGSPAPDPDLFMTPGEARAEILKGAEAWLLQDEAGVTHLRPLTPSAVELQSTLMGADSSPVPSTTAERAARLTPPPVPDSFDCDDPELRKAIKQRPRVFMPHPGGVTPREVQLTLEPVPDAPTPKMTGLRRYSQPEYEEMKRFVAALREKDWICPCPNAPYAAPTVMVRKKDGTYRCTIDDRFTVNTLFQNNVWPLPHMGNLMDGARGRYFTALDATDAYYAVPVREGDECKLAWRMPIDGGAVWGWRVMPQGCKQAPGTFTRLMTTILQDFIAEGWCLVYLDDVLIVDSDAAAHRRHVLQVLDRLQNEHIYLKLSKCQFMKSELIWLGHKLSAEGIAPDPKKVQAIQAFPAPTGTPKQCKSRVRSFLGMAGYYRRLIRNFAHMALPLTHLTREDVEWQWGEKEQQAFEALKAALISAPVMAAPDYSRPFIVHTDASDFACGAVLSQIDGTGAERVVAYYSHKYTPQEASADRAHERELLAVVLALQEWRHYLMGKHFTVYTDNAAVSWVLKQKHLTAKQARWVQQLAEYDFSIVHKPGQLNVVADALSRRPDHETVTAQTVQARLLRALHRWFVDCQLRALCARCHAEVVHAQQPAPANAPQPMIESLRERMRALFQAAPNPQFQAPPADAAEAPAVPAAQEEAPAPPAGLRLELDGEDLEQLMNDALADPNYQRDLLRAQSAHPAVGFVAQGDLLWDVRSQPPRLVVPEGSLRKSLLREAHDAAGHLGQERTLALLQRYFWWNRMDRTVAGYVRDCDLCQRNRSVNHRSAGLLQPLPVPTRCFQRIGVDLITGLPTTSRGHDALLVIVDHLSRRLILVPCTKTLTSEQFADLYFEHVYRHWGLPEEIVSDRGSIFTADSWRTLSRRLKTKLRLSSAYHPQTDGLTERMNRVIEDMLRAYISPAQTDWDQWITPVEFWYNNSRQVSTGKTPFELSIGQHPRTPLQALYEAAGPVHGNANALLREQRWREALDTAKRCLAEAQARQRQYYDRNRPVLELKPGDQVFLSTKNLRHPAGTVPKLSARRIGPFKVTEIINPVAVRIDLSRHPNLRRVHNVFHVSLLEPARIRDPELEPNEPAAPAPNPERDAEWTPMEELSPAVPDPPRILPRKVVGVVPEDAPGPESAQAYIARWLDGTISTGDTFEPAEAFTATYPDTAPQLIADFWARKARKDAAAAAAAAKAARGPTLPTRDWGEEGRRERREPDRYVPTDPHAAERIGAEDRAARVPQANLVI